MKKLFLISLCVTLCFCLAGCVIETEEERLARIEAYNKEVEEYNAKIEAEKNKTTTTKKKKEEKPKATKKPKTTEKSKTTEKPTTTTKPSAPQEDPMISQFKKLGFTDDEAKKMKEIFTTVGITKISNIKPGLGSGIDNLQSFICNIYDSNPDKGGLSVHFTIDKRQLCFISLDGIATTKVDYAYINIFGNIKFKTSNGKKSVTLYDVWDENGEIIPNAIGYKAVLDYKNNKIEAYK